MFKSLLYCIVILVILVGCTSSKPPLNKPAKPIPSLANIKADGAGREVVMYALGLLEKAELLLRDDTTQLKEVEQLRGEIQQAQANTNNDKPNNYY